MGNQNINKRTGQQTMAAIIFSSISTVRESVMMVTMTTKAYIRIQRRIDLTLPPNGQPLLA
tara:strand:- start:145 stop:327 length:183 start_codon:yes stop_codon:yes gene_type:complete